MRTPSLRKWLKPSITVTSMACFVSRSSVACHILQPEDERSGPGTGGRTGNLSDALAVGGIRRHELNLKLLHTTFSASVLSLKFLEQFEESKMFQKLRSGAEAHLVLQCLRHD